MAKRKTSLEKCTDVIIKKLQNTENAKSMGLDEFKKTFQVCRETNKRSRVSKKGSIYLESTGEVMEYESNYEKAILEIMDKSTLFLCIRTQALVIPYTYRGESGYFPDIVGLTKGGIVAIIEVKDTMSMLNKRNLAKYNALTDFCTLLGFTYVMLNKDISYEDLLERKVPEILRVYLTKILDTNGNKFSWAYVKDNCKHEVDEYSRENMKCPKI